MPVDPKDGAMEKEAVKRLLENVEIMSKGLPEIREELKALQAKVKEFADLDVSKALKEFERTKASMEQVREAIRSSKGGFYIPGLEDAGKKFSLTRAFIGAKTGDWKGAEHEKEIFDQVRSKASHIIGNDSAAGLFIPDQVIPDVIAAIYTRSQLIDLAGDGRTRVSVLDGLTGIPAKLPKFNGGVIAYWLGEEDEYVESLVNVGNMSLTPKKLGILVRLTDEMRRFQSFGFENLLRADMTRAAAKKIDWTVLYGSGSENMPRGVVNWPGVGVYSAENGTSTQPASPAGAALDFDGLDNMAGILEDADIDADSSFATISCPRFFRRMRQLKTDNYSGQTTNRPYLIGVPMLPEARLRDVIGEFGKSTQLPTTNKPGASVAWTSPQDVQKCTDVFQGNWANVLFGRWSGLEIADDGGLGKGFTSDHTYIKVRMYSDVGCRYEQSIVICPDAKVRD